jgi:signal transduction histidine kinase
MAAASYRRLIRDTMRFMTHLAGNEHPADRTSARWVFDVLVTLAAWGSALPYLFRANPEPKAAAVLVLACVAAPLLVRRRWPLAVFGAVGVTAVIAGTWDSHVIAGLALLIALYTVANLRPLREALVAAAILETLMVLADVRSSGVNAWPTAIFLSGMVAAALGLGLYAATRAAYLSELRDRAQRLEHERDQQGALAAAAERARIAREMHDIVAHHLTVMVALSDGAIATSATSPAEATKVMRSVSATGRRALADTRRLLGVLRTPGQDRTGPALEPPPGLAELDALIAGVRSAGLATTFEVHGAPVDVPDAMQLTVYRLVQEALTNTLKHGGPQARASVQLRYLPDELNIEVLDDGDSVMTAAPGAGIGGGLIGMQERVAAFGGDVSFGPRHPAGWRVSARLHPEHEPDVR